MKLTLVTEPVINQDELQIDIYEPRSIFDWLFNKPKKITYSQFFPGRINIDKFLVSSEFPLDYGQKLNAIFGHYNYVGIMPLNMIEHTTYPYVYECCVDSIEEVK